MKQPTFALSKPAPHQFDKRVGKWHVPLGQGERRTLCRPNRGFDLVHRTMDPVEVLESGLAICKWCNDRTDGLLIEVIVDALPDGCEAVEVGELGAGDLLRYAGQKFRVAGRRPSNYGKVAGHVRWAIDVEELPAPLRFYSGTLLLREVR